MIKSLTATVLAAGDAPRAAVQHSNTIDKGIPALAVRKEALATRLAKGGAMKAMDFWKPPVATPVPTIRPLMRTTATGPDCQVIAEQGRHLRDYKMADCPRKCHFRR